MFRFINRKTMVASASLIAGLMAGAQEAQAQQDFSKIASNITTSIQDLPGLLTGLAYMLGILLGVLGILKIKDHVENPTQTHLKDGAIRLAAGGGLFALPIVYEAMSATVGQGAAPDVAKVNKIQMGLN